MMKWRSPLFIPCLGRGIQGVGTQFGFPRLYICLTPRRWGFAAP